MYECTSSGRRGAVDREFVNIIFSAFEPTATYKHALGPISGCLGPKRSLWAARVSSRRCSTCLGEPFYKQKALKYSACPQNRVPRNSRDTAGLSRTQPHTTMLPTHQVLLRAPFLRAGARMTVAELTPSK